jgi:hypothetical protein
MTVDLEQQSLDIEERSLENYLRLYYSFVYNMNPASLKTRQDLEHLLDSDDKPSMYNSIMVLYNSAKAFHMIIQETTFLSICRFLLVLFIELFMFPFGLLLALVYIVLLLIGCISIVIAFFTIAIVLILFIMFFHIIALIIDIVLILPNVLIIIMMKVLYNKDVKYKLLIEKSTVIYNAINLYLYSADDDIDYDREYCIDYGRTLIYIMCNHFTIIGYILIIFFVMVLSTILN